MEKPENVKNDYIVKIVLIGDTQVGKTQIINQWVHHKVEKTSPTIGVEFASKQFKFRNKKIRVNIWDTAGPERYRSLLSVYFRDSNLIFLVVAADLSPADKIEQIKKWSKMCPSGLPIIIIENKTDIPKVTLLTDAELANAGIQYFTKVSISALQGDIAALNTAIEAVLLEIFPPLKLDIAAHSDSTQQLPLRIAYEITKTNFTALNDTQVNMLCTSLRNLLIRGPINQPDKSYDMKFGGGITYIDEKIPEHVHAWISRLDFPEGTTAEAKRSQLITVYEDIINVSQQKPFFRSSNTHDFYSEQLTGLIESWVTKSDDENFPYFTIRENLRNLANFPENIGLDAVRKNIINHLQLGPLSNQTLPYNVSFFGSKKHKLPDSNNSIAVPAHVSTILNYLNNDQASTLLKLIFVLDYSIASKFSTCRSRDTTTQEFYNNLPTFIAAEITRTLKSLQGENALRSHV